MTALWEQRIGRTLIALLFVAGTLQKVIDPGAVEGLLAGKGLPQWLVWPAMLFNAIGAICLIAGIALRPVALALAAYCVATSWFHFIPGDGWQMSIFIKNLAIAGGLLILASTARTTARNKTVTP